MVCSCYSRFWQGPVVDLVEDGEGQLAAASGKRPSSLICGSREVWGLSQWLPLEGPTQPTYHGL